MRILIVSDGFRPLVPYGGLVQATEDLLEALVRRGHAVSYFVSGRFYPRARRIYLKQWQRQGIHIFEVVNAPLAFQTNNGWPDDLQAPVIEQIFDKVLRQLRPAVVHFRGMAAFPSSLLEQTKRYQIATVLSIHDYSLLCPARFLMDWNNELCLEKEVGSKCIQCLPYVMPPQPSPALTIRYELRRWLPAPVFRLARFGYRWLTSKRNTEKEHSRISFANTQASYFQHRRRQNLRRVQQVDMLVFQSQRSVEIWQQLALAPLPPYRVIAPVLAHVASLPVRTMHRPQLPITFGTLSAFAGPYKGASLLAKALRIVDQQGWQGQYRLVVFGAIHPDYQAFVEHHPAIYYRGNYQPRDLPNILSQFDVGLALSLAEETYGHTVIEMLASGIPVIATPRGGAPEYVRPALSGWLLSEITPEVLAATMIDILKAPSVVAQLNAAIREHRKQFVKTIDTFAAEMETVYREAIEIAHSHPAMAE